MAGVRHNYLPHTTLVSPNLCLRVHPYFADLNLKKLAEKQIHCFCTCEHRHHSFAQVYSILSRYRYNITNKTSSIHCRCILHQSSLLDTPYFIHSLLTCAYTLLYTHTNDEQKLKLQFNTMAYNYSIKKTRFLWFLCGVIPLKGVHPSKLGWSAY